MGCYCLPRLHTENQLIILCLVRYSWSGLLLNTPFLTAILHFLTPGHNGQKKQYSTTIHASGIHQWHLLSPLQGVLFLQVWMYACGWCMHVYVCMFVRKKKTQYCSYCCPVYLSSTLNSLQSSPCLPQAVSRLFDTCSPLLNGCKKNRDNWLLLTKEGEAGNSENSSIVTLAIHKNNEEAVQTEE